MILLLHIACEPSTARQDRRFLHNCHKNASFPMHFINTKDYVRMKINADSLVIAAGHGDYNIRHSLQTVFTTEGPTLDLRDSTAYEIEGLALVMGIGDYTYDEDILISVEVLAHAYTDFKELMDDLQARWNGRTTPLPVKSPNNTRGFDVSVNIMCVTRHGDISGGGLPINKTMGNHTSIKSQDNTIELLDIEVVSETAHQTVYRVGFGFKGEIHDISNRIDDFDDISGEFYTQILIEH